MGDAVDAALGDVRARALMIGVPRLAPGNEMERDGLCSQPLGCLWMVLFTISCAALYQDTFLEPAPKSVPGACPPQGLQPI